MGKNIMIIKSMKMALLVSQAKFMCNSNNTKFYAIFQKHTLLIFGLDGHDKVDW